MYIFQKKIKYFLPSLFLLGFFILPTHSFAAELTFEQQTFPVPQELIQETGLFNIKNTNQLTTGRITLADIFKTNPNPPQAIQLSFTHNPINIFNWVNSITKQINRPVTEPLLTLEGKKVTAFNPGTNGIEVDVIGTTLSLLYDLENKKEKTAIISSVTKPTKTLASTNSLGITELITSGQSDFSHSSKNRIQNVTTGANHIKGALVPPGAEFSFNTTLGDITAKEGYAPEIVIKKTGLEPELGGGICQVSSTVFRAAFNGGLPITQRKNHSFAVSHYSPQGTDATIYPGVVDLKFKNDTTHHILIWPRYPNNHTLVFDFYGTKDDRQVTIKPAQQFDKKPDGSMKASWERLVTKNGETKTDVIKSTYLSPSLFKKEEKTTITETTPNPQQIKTPLLLLKAP